MLAQPLRLAGLALSYAVAAATLVAVTVLASNLVLGVVAGLGPPEAVTKPPHRSTVEGVLLSGQRSTERCSAARSRAGTGTGLPRNTPPQDFTHGTLHRCR